MVGGNLPAVELGAGTAGNRRSFSNLIGGASAATTALAATREAKADALDSHTARDSHWPC